MSSDTNRFEAYLGGVYQFHEDRVGQLQAAQAQDDLANAQADELRHLNDQRRQTNEGHLPVDLWGPEAAALCSDFIEFATKYSGARRNLIGATYLRGDDPKEEYTTYTGIFRQKPVVRTRVTGVGWRMSGYPIAYTDPQPSSVTEHGEDKDPLIIPKPDIYLCKDGLVRHHHHPLDLANAEELAMPIFPNWTRTRKRDVKVWYDGQESRHETVTYSFSLRFTELSALEGLERRLKELALVVNDGFLNNAPDDF